DLVLAVGAVAVRTVADPGVGDARVIVACVLAGGAALGAAAGLVLAVGTVAIKPVAVERLGNARAIRAGELRRRTGAAAAAAVLLVLTARAVGVAVAQPRVRDAAVVGARELQRAAAGHATARAGARARARAATRAV